MKIVTWNVNSIRVRLEQLTNWIKSTTPDVIALQETKCEDDKFPIDAFTTLGYQVICSGQKTFNGVAILSRLPIIKHVESGYVIEHDHKRVLIGEVKDYLIVDVYVPNGQSVGSDKYQFKLEWLKELKILLQRLLQKNKKIIVLGDFNIAPETIDHTSANFIRDEIMISDKERQAFHEILDLGFCDSFRFFDKEPKKYTWWDYRIRAFEKNLGYRIDHILVSDVLKDQCKSCVIDTSLRGLEKPSDHAPVILEL